MLSRIFSVSFISIILFSCGGEGSSPTENTTVTAAGGSSSGSGSSSALILTDGSESTVGTIDINNDGVWDEFEIGVSTLGYTQPAQISAIRQSIKSSQEIFLYGSGEMDSSIQEVGNQMKESVTCLVEVFGEGYIRLQPELALITINTQERSRAQQEFDRASVGQLFSATTAGAPCE